MFKHIALAIFFVLPCKANWEHSCPSLVEVIIDNIESSSTEFLSKDSKHS